MSVELWQVTIMRKVLNDFCAHHDMSVRDRTAITAAGFLMKFATEGEADAGEFRTRLDEAMLEHLLERNSVAKQHGGHMARTDKCANP
ncbi:hypothetical protein [Rhizobium sullae]|uniref:Uncharacterized protein n=1 Tax=Rhizobium sullae TaxID=50338 RepID=A0A2N0D5Z5_RHISU|nr:hypothetical protein [Rhizobium sullae]PKA41515.1 hypothetical protein CWR43_22120 [Rhizobium sullae]TCU14465.1 hypothetical protein EV132_109188 [Rhizobium sullae]UWU13154.1 hypothetical protein N2599_13420 [Rhizobium sullae]